MRRVKVTSIHLLERIDDEKITPLGLFDLIYCVRNNDYFRGVYAYMDDDNIYGVVVISNFDNYLSNIYNKIYDCRPTDEQNNFAYAVNPKFRRQGYGLKIIKDFHENMFFPYDVIIEKNNIASINVFKKAGIHLDFKNGYYYMKAKMDMIT